MHDLDLDDEKIKHSAAESIAMVVKAAEEAAKAIATKTVEALNVTNARSDVILEKFDGLKELINEKFKENSADHIEIKAKQDHTNGDVSSLKLWRSFLLGAWAVISVLLMAILIPLANNYLKNQQDVRAQVSEAMGEYLEKTK